MVAKQNESGRVHLRYCWGTVILRNQSSREPHLVRGILGTTASSVVFLTARRTLVIHCSPEPPFDLYADRLKEGDSACRI